MTEFVIHPDRYLSASSEAVQALERATLFAWALPESDAVNALRRALSDAESAGVLVHSEIRAAANITQIEAARRDADTFTEMAADGALAIAKFKEILRERP